SAFICYDLNFAKMMSIYLFGEKRECLRI
ncbi:unknown protein, partial [Waddlia chondrophila 2032/99]